VVLVSKLSKPEQHQLTILGELLGGRITNTFSGSGNVCVTQTAPRQGVCFFNVPVKPLRILAASDTLFITVSQLVNKLVHL